jgi:hypothetical protein
MLFLSGQDSVLVFSRRVRYRLVWPLSIPVDSPRDKRGIVWSGNRGLRFGIGADYGRISELFLKNACSWRLQRVHLCPRLTVKLGGVLDVRILERCY